MASHPGASVRGQAGQHPSARTSGSYSWPAVAMRPKRVKPSCSLLSHVAVGRAICGAPAGITRGVACKRPAPCPAPHGARAYTSGLPQTGARVSGTPGTLAPGTCQPAPTGCHRPAAAVLASPARGCGRNCGPAPAPRARLRPRPHLCSRGVEKWGHGCYYMAGWLRVRFNRPQHRLSNTSWRWPAKVVVGVGCTGARALACCRFQDSTCNNARAGRAFSNAGGA